MASHGNRKTYLSATHFSATLSPLCSRGNRKHIFLSIIFLSSFCLFLLCALRVSAVHLCALSLVAARLLWEICGLDRSTVIPQNASRKIAMKRKSMNSLAVVACLLTAISTYAYMP